MSYFRPKYTSLLESKLVDSEQGEQHSQGRVIGPGIPGPIEQEQDVPARGDTWETTALVCSGSASLGGLPSRCQQDLRQIHHTCGTG